MDEYRGWVIEWYDELMKCWGPWFNWKYGWMASGYGEWMNIGDEWMNAWI